MVDQCLICDILMTIVNEHSHDDSSMKKKDLIDFADGDMDHDILREKIDSVVDELEFLDEWGNYRETRIHLDQDSGEIVYYLIDECGESAPWIEPPLDHVPNEVWEDVGVTPSV